MSEYTTPRFVHRHVMCLTSMSDADVFQTLMQDGALSTDDVIRMLLFFPRRKEVLVRVVCGLARRRMKIRGVDHSSTFSSCRVNRNMTTTYTNCEHLTRAVSSCGVDDGSETYRKCIRQKNVDTQPVTCQQLATPSSCQNGGYTTSLHGCTSSSASHERVHVLPTRGSPSWVQE